MNRPSLPRLPSTLRAMLQRWTAPHIWRLPDRPANSPSAEVPSSRLRRQWLLVGLVAAGLLAVVTVQYLVKVQTPDELGRQSRSAFLRWRGMIHELMAGGNIYVGRNEYPNAPIMALILWPFAALPPLCGALLWLYFKAAAAVMAGIWVIRTVAPPRLSLAGCLLSVAVALPAIIGDLTHNNVNIFILFLVAAMLELYRRGQDCAAGLTLALAIACKLTPLLFVPYFAWKRQWRLLHATGVGLAVWLFIVPSWILGWEWNWQLLRNWSELMIVRPILRGEVVSEHPNQALVGWTYRLFSQSPSFVRYERTPQGDIPVPAAYHYVVDLGRPTVGVLSKLWHAGWLVGLVVLCRPDRRDRHGWLAALEYAFVVLGMLLLSERTWKHHAVTLIIPAAALIAAVAAGNLSPRGRLTVLIVIAAAGLLMVVPGLCGRHIQDLALVYGTHTVAFLGLMAAVAGVLWQHRRDGRMVESEWRMRNWNRESGMGNQQGGVTNTH